jgi:hypothetical protein
MKYVLCIIGGAIIGAVLFACWAIKKAKGFFNQ